MIMNFELMRGGFLPINIKNENREKYYETLDTYAVNGNLEEFMKSVYDFEKATLLDFLEFYGKGSA